jgi:hypothetical protein
MLIRQRTSDGEDDQIEADTNAGNQIQEYVCRQRPAEADKK